MVSESDAPVGMTRPEPRKIAVVNSSELKLEAIAVAVKECRPERKHETGDGGVDSWRKDVRERREGM